jgi:hypothetical protein
MDSNTIKDKKERAKLANKKWRDANGEKFREIQRKFYKENIQNEQWKQYYHDRIKRNIERKKQNLIEQGILVRTRGRPRKINI